MQHEKLVERLNSHFPQAEIKVKDLTGTGDHWEVSIQSSHFRGKTPVQQHRMVYAALGDWMKKEIHALQLTTMAL